MHTDILTARTGSGGLTAVTQLQNTLKKQGRTFAKEDIVIVDPAEYHYYQPGW
jgi:sulfide:quinone oxidoreductase